MDSKSLLVNADLFARLKPITEAYVQEYMKQYKDCSHDWSHVQRVRRFALEIAAAEIALGKCVNIQLVELAALLHDVGDAKFIIDPNITTEDMLRSFMMSVGYPTNVQDAIVWVVGRISFRHELAHGCTVEGDHLAELYCVQDADRLEAIGAIGIARCFAYTGARNQPLYEADVLPLVNITAEQYNQLSITKQGNARNHFYEKLFKIHTRLKTEHGKQEGQRRLHLLRFFIEEFDRECHLSNTGLLDFN